MVLVSDKPVNALPPKGGSFDTRLKSAIAAEAASYPLKRAEGAGDAPHGAAPAGTSSVEDVSPALEYTTPRTCTHDAREVVAPWLGRSTPLR